mmetsp:Transcript_7476/g.26289  ORF Transcript_7476/g.26289 Transcript_7476/m.26289 type:complete len:256 (-) Transcript_7476:484-1251(-)
MPNASLRDFCRPPPALPPFCAGLGLRPRFFPCCCFRSGPCCCCCALPLGAFGLLSLGAPPAGSRPLGVRYFSTVNRRICGPVPLADPAGTSTTSSPPASLLAGPARTFAPTMARLFASLAPSRSTRTLSGYVRPSSTPALARASAGAPHGACTCLVGRPLSSGTHLLTYSPLGSWYDDDGLMVKFHWSMPLLPAFCHIMLLMARSASTRVPWNQSAPCVQLMLRYSVRNAAAAMRTLCCIHPVAHSSRMPASTSG